MTRLIHGSFAIAILAGFLVFADIAEAQKIRSPVERRLRPGQGFWSNGSSSSLVPRNNGYSAPRSYAQPQQYTAPQQQYAAPQRYTAPPQQYVAPRQYVAPQQYVAPRPNYVQPRYYVNQPR